MAGTFQDFLSDLLAFESGWDRDRYEVGIITDGQLDSWAGGSVEEFFSGYSSWSDLTASEWETMAYRSMNTFGFVGYQFGEALLIDLGYYDDDFYYGNGAATNTWDGTWTGKNGVTSLEDFMTKEAQDVAIQEAFGHNLSIIEEGLSAAGKNLDDYIGTAINGVTVTLTGLLASAHLRGAPAAVDLLLNGTLSSDEYGTSILQYMEQFGGFDAPTFADLIDYFEDRLTGDEGLGMPGDVVADNGSAGVTAETADVAITWDWGSNDVVTDFDPATDTVFVDWFTSEHLDIYESEGSVVFAIASNNQTTTLQGISLAALSAANFTILDATAAQEILALVGSGDGSGGGDGGSTDTGDTETDAGGSDDTQDGGSGSGGGDVSGGNGTANVTEATATVAITWAWGSNDVVTDFDPATDTLFVDWFTSNHIDIYENDGSTVFEIASNNQTTTLQGVSLADLSAANFTILDDTAAQEILALVGSGDGSGGGDGGSSGDSDASDPPATTGTTDLGGTKYQVDFNAGDLTNFDVSKDELDFGDISVHGMIITKTPQGELAIDNPWGPEMQVLQGVNFSDLSLENFGVVGNEHLREDIGGVLSWELGAGPRDDDTIYIRSHEYGVHEVINNFDPATMNISFIYFGTREQLSVDDTDAGLVISSLPTGQSFTFTGISLSDLQPGTLEFHFDQVMEDNLEAPFGFSQNDVSLVSREALLTPEAPEGATTDGYQIREGVMFPDSGADDSGGEIVDSGGSGGDSGAGDGSGGTGGNTPPDDGGTASPPSGDVANGIQETVHITWNWAAQEVVSGFAPSEDVLDFGALPAAGVALSEIDGNLNIEVLGNGGHTYILENVQAEDLTLANLTAPSWNDPVLDSVIGQLVTLGNDDFA